MSCDNVITVQELETDKKHSTYYREVITGKSGGTGADIDFATNAVTGQTQKTLTKAINELGGMGYARAGTFKVGATLTTARQTLLWDIADGGDGQEYGWSGAFPKVVPANSTPSITGGIAVGAWMSRFDPELRDYVVNTTTATFKNEYGYSAVDNMIAGRVKGIAGAVAHRVGNIYSTGGTTWECKVDGVASDIANFTPLSPLYVSDFKNAGSDADAFEAAAAHSQATSKFLHMDSDLVFDRMVTVTGEIYFDCMGHTIKPIPVGFQDIAVIRFGINSAASCSGEIRLVKVDCDGGSMTGVYFGHTSTLHCDVEVTNFTGHGVEHNAGYELTLNLKRVRSSSAPVTPSVSIVNSTNAGLVSRTSDSVYTGAPVHCDVGFLIKGGNNMIVDAHPWGVYSYNTKRMRVGFVDAGENNIFNNCMSDSPCVVDYEKAASEINGGFGFYTAPSGDGFSNKYINCTVFIPSIAPEVGSHPVGKIEGFYVGRAALSYKDYNVIDRTGTTMAGHFTGSFADKCLRENGKEYLKHYTASTGALITQTDGAQFVFSNRIWANRGLTFNVAYDANEYVAAPWGAVRHELKEGANWYSIIINDAGVTRTMKIEKTQKGTQIQRGFLNLTSGDAMYKFYNTTTNRYNVWNGTGWTDMVGNSV